MIVLAIFVLLPILYPQQYVVHILSLAMIFAIAALALQLLLGFAGLLSIGQAAFLGIDAYTSAIITTTYKAPFELGFVAAGLVAGLASLSSCLSRGCAASISRSPPSASRSSSTS
jgi:branched-chain amino acid transport system permease protein